MIPLLRAPKKKTDLISSSSLTKATASRSVGAIGYSAFEASDIWPQNE